MAISTDIKNQKLEDRCLYYYTHKEHEGTTGFGVRRYDCDRCDGYKVECRLYEARRTLRSAKHLRLPTGS